MPPTPTVTAAWDVRVKLRLIPDIRIFTPEVGRSGVGLSLASRCESCGMPMPTNEDHGAHDPDNPYCIHCTDLDGKLLPFEKKFDELVASTMDTRWMSREEAERSVREQLLQMPAWRSKVEKLMAKTPATTQTPTQTPSAQS